MNLKAFLEHLNSGEVVKGGSEAHLMDGAIKGLEGWIYCFDKAKLKGIVRGLGVGGKGTIYNMPSILKEAYEMGKAV